ncbi:MAG TPA: Asp-tRNA(Asn)/Glu-tRNA(Gln) amidotransferase subunit GatC [Gemmatimonadales bacterium]|nr:Asp-tRNA(Asn)/Glu-tRNA(Gln) amidotransferase subunit GatC [Gemmatimonadales bacterium]
MTIGADQVRHIARLAEIAVADDELPVLAKQLDRIVGYVAQLDRLPADEDAAPFNAGPESLRLRADQVNPWPMIGGPMAMAPESADGFFLVPRRGTGAEA